MSVSLSVCPSVCLSVCPLQQAGFRLGMTEVTAVKGVAMTINLAIPWNKAPGGPKKVDTMLITQFC